MDQHELIKFLNRIYCWIPSDNPISGEIKQMVLNLGGSVSELSPYVSKSEKQGDSNE